ncbi:hypothetical protein HZP35_19030, partial [Elizabethkingia anophelis]|nr:hypothetical protein [Elizabethkingia anophelis]MCT4157029.1 hypothetical protein [Elizabethkingia anophelis]MCT4171354.1 hypothetical protein [Elizabethkingia anophelis]MCT4245767.1 hypothetical protein [Elizabethkingia anophelis]MCT4249469.1 hypothetical protein [Elizabethkingia anophelis]
MSNKTALQELLEWIDSEDYNLSELESYILSHRKELLEKERYQIMGSYSAGCVCGYIMTDTEYYDGQYGNP